MHVLNLVIWFKLGQLTFALELAFEIGRVKEINVFTWSQAQEYKI